MQGHAEAQYRLVDSETMSASHAVNLYMTLHSFQQDKMDDQLVYPWSYGTVG